MMNTVYEINKSVSQDVKAFIEESEANYKREIKSIADHINANRHLKLIMLAGPSGSGKTTSAHILCNCLKELGIDSKIISLDNFYLDAEKLPILPNGEKDTESVNSLDLAEIRRCFEDIIKIGKTRMPVFDFENKKSIKDALEIEALGGVIIVEGLHALNPQITDSLPEDSLYKIYVSVNRSIFDEDGYELLSSRKIRLMRRVLRDEKFRGTEIKTTLRMWTQVVGAETQYLYPFKNKADKLLVTLHPYEVCVYKNAFIKAVEGINISDYNYAYAAYTAGAAKKFCDIDMQLVPEDSLIREFIGGGNIKY